MKGEGTLGEPWGGHAGCGFNDPYPERWAFPGLTIHLCTD